MRVTLSLEICSVALLGFDSDVRSNVKSVAARGCPSMETVKASLMALRSAVVCESCSEKEMENVSPAGVIGVVTSSVGGVVSIAELLMAC